MRIPRNVIDEIEQRNDIVDVVGSYVNLKRAGSNWNGLCPFHSEKTPSFTVFPASSSFYCFGCGAGGDVITFIMRTENVDYPEALEFLAKRAGIKIPAASDAGGRGEQGLSRRRVFEMNLEAARFFRACLFNKNTGAQALEYLAEQRGLSGSVIKHFGLGFAPDSFSMLGDHLRSRGFRNEELRQAYLLGYSERGGRYYDQFRNRVMFPIIDTIGNVIAFGGRVMDDSKPKYLNSSDTPGFKKSRNLFALNFAKSFSGESMILCEGYMDVIALHAAGFQNAVATLGTAITADQARIMAKYTKKVIINYDSDEAGQRAADKAMRLLGEVGLEVRVLKLDGAKDPDEFITKFGKDRFRLQLEGSRSGFEHKFNNITAKYDTGTTEGKIKAAGELCEVIASVGQSVERDVYIAYTAERLSLSAASMKDDIEKIRRRRYKEFRQKEGRDAFSAAKYFGDRVNPDAAKNVAAAGAEEVILGLLLMFEEHRVAVAAGRQGFALTEDDFFTEFGRKLFSVILELQADEGGYAQGLLGQYFTPEEMGRIHKLIRMRAELSNNSSEVLRDTIENLKHHKKLEAARESGDKFAALTLKRQIVKNKSDKHT